MSKSGWSRSFHAGYRSWFQPFRYNERVNIPIFILDYETHSQWEDTHEPYPQYEDREYNKSKLINGIQIYFLDEDHQKRKAFLRHEPYFFLLLEDGLPKNEINRIMTQISEIGDQQVIKVERGDYYDAANLTFLVKYPFLKVTVDRPGTVPKLRTKSEEIARVKEWREADVLFHHRCAIDHDVRVGAWYLAEISRGEILNLSLLAEKTPPQLKILAFDIETDFEQTRDPNPNKDQISMISMFTGEDNKLIINSKIVDTENVKKHLYMLLRQTDDAHPKPWVDWVFSKTSQEFNDVIEWFPIEVITVPTEKELIQLFYQYIDDYHPDVLTDFFGGRFDIPFLAIRSEKYKISLEKETGFKIKFRQTRNLNRKELHKYYSSANIDHVAGAGIIHLDAYLFNEKYSYLPKKDLGLKPSVEKKLKIIPIGKEALFNIKKDPVSAVAYAGCDGYITWKYVREIVLDFFISMGQIFPVTATELLTRRAGSLDDLLIDAEDHKHQIIGRRRIGQNNIVTFSPSIVIESLAYTGGLVEAKRPGIWRSDLYYDHTVNKKALESLKQTIKGIITRESNRITKEVTKEEFEKRLLAELGEVKVEYLEDPVQFLKQVEVELLKNGTPRQELIQQLNSIRDILEEMSGYQPVNVEKVIANVLAQIDQLTSLNGKTQLKGVHVDVTSMYPSQIRQYKLQPSGIVSTTKCRVCELAEPDDSCFFEGDWVIKLSANRPCSFKDSGPDKCSSSVCKAQDEANCKKYDPTQNGITRSREIFTFDGKKTHAYVLRNGSRLEKVPVNRTFLGSSISKNPFIALQQWLRNSIEATQLTTKLNNNHFDIFEDIPENIQLPENSFLSLDVRTKKMTILLSVNSRVCQKAYNFVARIMDDFFNTRVRHKIEAKRLSQIISQKYQNKPAPPQLLRQQKFHESTQIGMKVPLNSIFPDEPIIIVDDKGIQPVEIGYFVEENLKNSSSSSSPLNKGIKTFTFDDDGKISLKNITHVFKHKTDHRSFLVTTENGRKVKITDDHSIFIIDDEQNIIVVKGDEVKNGDRIVIPKFFPKVSPNFSSNRINLIKLIDPNVLVKNDINLMIKVRGGYFISKRWKTEEKLFTHIINAEIQVPKQELAKLFNDPRTAERNLSRSVKQGLISVNNDCYYSNDYSKTYLDFLRSMLEKSERNHHTNSYDIPLVEILEFIKKLPDKLVEEWEIGHYSGKYLKPIVFSALLAKYLGYYASEGYRRIQGESYDVNICNADKIITNDMIRCASVFGEPKTYKKNDSNVMYIRSNNAVAYSILESMKIGNSSKTKRIPQLIFNMTNENKLEFLKTLISGDGTVDKKGKYIQYSSISKSLIYTDLALLLLQLSIYRFTIREEEYNENTIYRIKILQSINGIASFEYERRKTSLDLVPNEWIPIKYMKKMSTTIFKEKNLQSRIVESDIWFDEVQSVEKIETPENVYDLSVEGTERFFAGQAYLGIHNSIYGLLGMKGGVRNASMPCAGITTKLSADLIFWAANQLEQIGKVVELDTDGIWLWVPKLFPLEFPVTIENLHKRNGSKVHKISLIDKILNEKVAAVSRNDNYWINNGEIEKIKRSSKSLIQFEQDGPYDFQFMMGKKKYIVYNYNKENEMWIEKELTGLESKRADFSKLQKYFQERIINTYLEHYNSENPITLNQLYENANRQANLIRSEMTEGRMDPSYFVKPKAINKPLRAYKSKLPQVSAAYILKDLGYSVDPGTRIQMLNIKGNHVIPQQLFDFEFKKIKEVLVKHAIATLSFMLGELSTKEDLMKLIDVKQYQEDIFGPGRIYDRMIKYPKTAQQLVEASQFELDLSEIPTTQVQEQRIDNQKKRKKTVTTEKQIKKPRVKVKKQMRRKTAVNRRLTPQGLDRIFQDKTTEIIRTPKSDSKIEKTPVNNKPESEQKHKEPIEKAPIITEEELQELETNEIFTNGNGHLEINPLEINTPKEELSVCSECGALVNPQEITREGCTFCGGQLLIQ